MPATPAWLAAVEAVLNRGVQSSQQAETLAHRLNATALRVDIRGMNSITLNVSEGKLVLAASDATVNAAPDATIAGSAPALLKLALGSGAPGPASDSARPTVHGDAEIASLYQKLIAAARPDVEEELSRLVGDLAARRLSLLAGSAFGWARSLRRTAGENIAEYLQEESRDLVNRTELEEFLHGVDVARETADRIEARLSRLEHRLKGSS
jgi:ubiquinone biosynthesis protein UbiJ